MAHTEVAISNKSVTLAERDREIGEILNRYSQFVQAKDLAGLLELYSDDVVIFDLMTPFQYVGSRALMSRVSDWFKGYEGAMTFDFDQLRVHSSETLAVAHALIKCGGVIKGDARMSTMWMRSTMTFMKHEDEWLIIHEHSSEPFDMETGRAITQRGEGDTEVAPSAVEIESH